MYKIEKPSYGFKLTFDGAVNADEMNQWVEESKKAIVGAKKDFGVLVDMRGLKPLGADAQAAMQEGQKLYKGAGMARSAVIVNSAITKMQFTRIAKETGIIEWSSEKDIRKPRSRSLFGL